METVHRYLIYSISKDTLFQKGAFLTLYVIGAILVVPGMLRRYKYDY